MKLSSSLLVTAVVFGTNAVTALVPAHLSYLTDKELDAAAANSAHRSLIVLDADVMSNSTDDDADADMMMDDDGADTTMMSNTTDDDVLDMMMDDDAEDEPVSLADNEDIDADTADIFDVASGGAVDDDEVTSDELTFSPPIGFSQYTSDTCDSDTLVFTGTIDGIKLIAEGEFCITQVLNDGGSIDAPTTMYTKLTNEICDIFGVQDRYKDCTDATCSDCSDEDNYLGLTMWDEIFPNPVEDHCFQQIFSNNGEDFEGDTTNVDFQIDTDSTDSGLQYTKFIVLNSCIKDFVSSDDTEFTEGSVTVTDEDGSSVTLTEDSLTLEDGDGSSIVLTDDSITLSGNDDDEGFVVEDGNLTVTDDGTTVIQNDDIIISITDEGEAIIMTDDFLTVANEDVFVTYLIDTVTFGSIVTGDNFTLDATYELNDDDSLKVTFDDGTFMIVKEDDVLVLGSPDSEEYTIFDTVYNYTDAYFSIVGSSADCDDIGIAFNADGIIVGSKDCGFFGVVDEDGSFVVGIESGDDPDTDDDFVVSTIDDDNEMMMDDNEMMMDGDSCESIETLLCGGGAWSDQFTTLCGLLENFPIPPIALTVFAPTNSAFENLFRALGDIEIDDDALLGILMFHVSFGKTMFDDLQCGELLDMLGSGSSRTKCGAPGRTEGEDFIIQKGGGNRKNNMEPTITFPDVQACNDSVVHVISEVMLPNIFDAL